MTEESTDAFDTLIKRLNAQHMETDESGTWTIWFAPYPEPAATAEDFSTAAECLQGFDGVQIAGSTANTVTFSLNFGSCFDPESTLTYVAELFQIALRDHITATEQRNERAKTATVTLLFRARHSNGQLMDMSDQVAVLPGVLECEPTDNNELVLKLNKHYATPEGIRIAVYSVAALFKAHVCGIETEEELMSRSDVGLMLGGMRQGVPLPASTSGPFPSLGFPEKTKAGAKAARRRRARRLTHQTACYAIRSRRN